MLGPPDSPIDGDALNKRVYLIRHGQTVRQGGKRFLGQAEYPLSKQGREQAQEFARKFAPLPLSAVASSDLGRCLETAQAIARAKGLEVMALPEFREINLGSWDGLSFAEVHAKYPEEFQRRGQDPVHYRTPGGESFDDVRARAVPAYERLLARLPGDMALVSHAGVIRVLLCHVLGTPLKDLFQYRPEHASVTALAYGPQGFEGINLRMDVISPQNRKEVYEHK